MTDPKLIRFVRVTYEADASVTLQLQGDLPAGAEMPRQSWVLPATVNRYTEIVRCSRMIQLQHGRLRFSPGGRCYLYEAAIYVRKIGREASDWQWVPVPIIPSSDLMPLRVPIPPTPDDYAALRVPIPETQDGYLAMKLPVPETPDEQRWVDLEMDE